MTYSMDGLKVGVEGILKKLTCAERERDNAYKDINLLGGIVRAQQEKIVALISDGAREAGMVFLVRDRITEANELVGQIMLSITDEVVWTWSKDAIVSGLGSMAPGIISGKRFAGLPRMVEAENWWHLCSIVGLTEGMARVCYNGMQSASKQGEKEC